jgi:transcriptional regulator with XRE-family HTH domain
MLIKIVNTLTICLEWLKKIVSTSFGKLIRKARIIKEYSQRELAKLIDVNYTYLSKLENDHADYPPSKEIIKSLSYHLNLDEKELIKLAGRISPEDAQIFKELIKEYEEMPVLLRRMRDNPDFAKKVFLEIDKQEIEE